jgi:hypothetical protein
MSDSEKIVILLDCFARTEAQAALAAFAGAGGDSSKVVAAPVTELVAAQVTSEAVSAVAAGSWPGGTPRSGGRRSALIAGADKRSAVALMRCFKSVIPADSDPAFAMVTETGRNWTVNEYLIHIRKEHDFMKTADPSMDPDMKAVE